MSDKSPLFVSALELLAHATELYVEGNPKKYKFVVLHLANAIELVLKDCLIDQGVSIYKGPKETLTIWATFSELEKLNVDLREKPVIELLIDDRNTIQHRFGFPNAESVYYYLEHVVAFFERFLDAHYALQLSEVLAAYLPERHLQMLGLVRNKYQYLTDLMALSTEAAIVQSFVVIEQKIAARIGVSVQGDLGTIRPFSQTAEVIADLERCNLVGPGAVERFAVLRRARNYAAHVATVEDEKIDWAGAFSVAMEFINALDRAVEAGYQYTGETSRNSPD